MREGQAMGKDVRVHHSSPVLYQSLELGEGDTWIDMAADNALHSILYFDDSQQDDQSTSSSQFFPGPPQRTQRTIFDKVPGHMASFFRSARLP